jgi:5'-3' exonuclease
MILIIDGNSLLNTISSVMLRSKGKSDIERPFFRVYDKWVIKDSAAEFYESALYRYISSILYSLKFVDKIYITVDSKSWRKFYFAKYMKQFINRDDYNDICFGYKGKRDKTGEFKEQLNELVKYLSRDTLSEFSRKVEGVRIVSVDGLEGDDLVYYLTSYFKKNNDVVVWTNDSDLHQVIDNNVYVIGSNDSDKKRKLFRLNENKQDIINTSDIFNFDLSYNMDSISTIFNGLIESGKYVENNVDLVYDIFTKILCGDKKSDNIPPVYNKLKNGKPVNVTQVRISDKIFNKLKKELNYTDSEILHKIDSFCPEFIKYISKQICTMFDIPNDDKYDDVFDMIYNCIIFNTKLIRLSDTTIPIEFLKYLDSIMVNYIESDTNFFMQNYLNFIKTKNIYGN